MSASTPRRVGSLGPPHPAGTPGFTLIELLIVIGIITLLLVIGLAVGARVSGEGKRRLTEQTLQALDQSLAEYIAAKDAIPPARVRDPEDEDRWFPLADAVVGGGSGEVINSIAYYVLEARTVGEVDAALRGLDPRIVREYQPPGTAGQPHLPTIFDAWGNPIRFVHPAFHGVIDEETPVERLAGPPPAGTTDAITDIRRDPGDRLAPGDPANDGVHDADGGMCVGGRPYFYSAGPDGDPSTIDDNLYTTRPQLPQSR